jgi:hypothetical protein
VAVLSEVLLSDRAITEDRVRIADVTSSTPFLPSIDEDARLNAAAAAREAAEEEAKAARQACPPTKEPGPEPRHSLALVHERVLSEQELRAELEREVSAVVARHAKRRDSDALNATALAYLTKMPKEIANKIFAGESVPSP